MASGGSCGGVCCVTLRWLPVLLRGWQLRLSVKVKVLLLVAVCSLHLHASCMRKANANANLKSQVPSTFFHNRAALPLPCSILRQQATASEAELPSAIIKQDYPAATTSEVNVWSIGCVKNLVYEGFAPQLLAHDKTESDGAICGRYQCRQYH